MKTLIYTKAKLPPPMSGWQEMTGMGWADIDMKVRDGVGDGGDGVGGDHVGGEYDGDGGGGEKIPF